MTMPRPGCPHGLDSRFCGLCKRARVAEGDEPFSLLEILRFLNDQQIRATYGAVGDAVGVIARNVGARLGYRRPEASWVVSAANGWPTGYHPGNGIPPCSEVRRSFGQRPTLSGEFGRGAARAGRLQGRPVAGNTLDGEAEA
jgi:hypothetical protein